MPPPKKLLREVPVTRGVKERGLVVLRFGSWTTARITEEAAELAYRSRYSWFFLCYWMHSTASGPRFANPWHRLRIISLDSGGKEEHTVGVIAAGSVGPPSFLGVCCLCMLPDEERASEHRRHDFHTCNFLFLLKRRLSLNWLINY